MSIPSAYPDGQLNHRRKVSQSLRNPNLSCFIILQPKLINSTAANRTLKAVCTSILSFLVITVIPPGTRGGMNHYLDVIT